MSSSIGLGSLLVVGLLARGLAEIGPRGGLEGWRWIFIIEGLMVSAHPFQSQSVATNLQALDRHRRSYRLLWASQQSLNGNLPDRRGARMGRETSRGHQGRSLQVCPSTTMVQPSTDFEPSLARERDERFRWSEVGRGVMNLQVWLTSTAYFAILSGLYSFGLFVSAETSCIWNSDVANTGLCIVAHDSQ